MISSRDFGGAVHWYSWALAAGLAYAALVAVWAVAYVKLRVLPLPAGLERTARLSAALSWTTLLLGLLALYLSWTLAPSMVRTLAYANIPPQPLLRVISKVVTEARLPFFYASVPLLVVVGGIAMVFMAGTDAPGPVHRRLLAVNGTVSAFLAAFSVGVMISMAHFVVMLRQMLPS